MTVNDHTLVLWNNAPYLKSLCHETGGETFSILYEGRRHWTDYLSVGGVRALLEGTCAEAFLLEFASEGDTWLLVKPAGQRHFYCTEEGTHEPMLNTCPILRNEFFNIVMDYSTVSLVLPTTGSEHT